MLEICRVPFVGGAERIALNCAEAVQAGGGRAIVACPPGGQMEASALGSGLECHPIAALNGRRGLAADLVRSARATVSNSRALTALSAREPLDLIHAHHPIGAFQAVRAAARARAPLVLHVHETLPAPRQYRALAGWLRQRCDAFICVSDAGRQLLRRLDMDERRIHLVYNAVGPAFFSSPTPAELGPGPHIGSFGVLERRKGHGDLIIALGRLAETHPVARLWIVGELSYAENAGYVDELKALASRWKVADRVHFTGYRSDIPELMAAMDVVALASREFESLPTVLLEAAALGRVSVATDVGGVREIIDHGITGLLVSPDDPSGMASALATALSPAAAQMGRCARAMALSRFSPERFERDLLALFGQFMGAQRATAG
ncbi:glycosyltransferase family 4 protein [Phenylobacterium sp.]|uniref:glycosyltransferase family 4 protein n=1 Tax=Phenylobacterium sp. TaxID=1871053 RepID=UPI002B87FB2E|nr:glycosyltransferase family 4 protein [Phenylobacterium sp.]HVI30556.1 glycosyltransferase family 4 protein [Phenylobacterium sp.]